MVPADWSAAAGYRVGTMLARIPELTAIFAANDHLAHRAAARAARAVPSGARRT